MANLQDFEIFIEADAKREHSFVVRAGNPRDESVSGLMELNLDDHELSELLTPVRDEVEDAEAREEFGSRRFKVLFRPGSEIRDFWHRSLGIVAEGEASGLRIRLLVREPPQEETLQPDEPEVQATSIATPLPNTPPAPGASCWKAARMIVVEVALLTVRQKEITIRIKW